jgi:hypothetical protein
LPSVTCTPASIYRLVCRRVPRLPSYYASTPIGRSHVLTLRNARDPSICKQRCPAGTRASEARRRDCCFRQLHMLAARTAWRACCATFGAVAARRSRIVRGLHGGYSARHSLSRPSCLNMVLFLALALHAALSALCSSVTCSLYTAQRFRDWLGRLISSQRIWR